jgi:transcription antitermination factor NusG
MGEAQPQYKECDRDMETTATTFTASTAWFALQTRYRYEERIAAELQTKGFESYLPRLREVHTWKDRKKVLEMPAFGGYLFARFEPSLQNRVRVLETTGVVKLLGNHGTPEPVSGHEIESLRLALESGAPCCRHPYVQIGTPVRVRRGALAGLEGRVLRMGNKLSVFVNVASVCQAIAVEVQIDDVETTLEALSA